MSASTQSPSPSPSSSSSPSLKDLDHILAGFYGVQLIGIFISLFLFGISCLQTFIYYMSKHQVHDPPWLRILPAWLMLMQALQQLLLCTAMYKIFVINFGTFDDVLVFIPLETYLADLFQALLTVAAQCFFIYRIWKFGRSKPAITKYIWLFPAIFVVLAVAQAVLVITNVCIALAHSRSVQYISHSLVWKGGDYAIGSLSVFLDMAFVMAMVWLLVYERRSPFSRTSSMINKLIILTINSGLVPAISALLALIFLAASPTTLIYVFFYYILAPLYCNSVLANLNVREHIRSHSDSSRTPTMTRASAQIEFARGRFPPLSQTLGDTLVADGPMSATETLELDTPSSTKAPIQVC